MADVYKSILGGLLQPGQADLNKYSCTKIQILLNRDISSHSITGTPPPRPLRDPEFWILDQNNYSIQEVTLGVSVEGTPGNLQEDGTSFPHLESQLLCLLS